MLCWIFCLISWCTLYISISWCFFLLLWGSPVFLFFNVSIKCPERLESFGVESPWAHGVSPLPLPAWRPWLQRRPKKCSTFPIRWHVTWWFASIASRTFSLISLRAVATHWSWRMLVKVNLDLTWLASLFFWSYGHDMFLTKQKIKRTKSEEWGWTETKAMSFLKKHLWRCIWTNLQYINDHQYIQYERH